MHDELLALRFLHDFSGTQRAPDAVLGTVRSEDVTVISSREDVHLDVAYTMLDTNVPAGAKKRTVSSWACTEYCRPTG